MNYTETARTGGRRQRMHAAQKFEQLLETYRQPDGRRWGGQDLHGATGGVVTRSYVTNLRKGRIENPGYDKMRAISKAMGFPPALWFEDGSGHGTSVRPARGSSVAERAERLFGAVRNPRTGEPYTVADVARMTTGDLTEGDVEGIRSGRIEDPTVGQVAALAGAFGVPPSYFLDLGKEPPTLDEELLDALRDETAVSVLREAARLPERERAIVLGVARQLGDQREPAHGTRRGTGGPARPGSCGV